MDFLRENKVVCLSPNYLLGEIDRFYSRPEKTFNVLRTCLGAFAPMQYAEGLNERETFFTDGGHPGWSILRR